MGKHLLKIAMLLGLIFSAAGLRAEMTGNVNLLLVSKVLDEDAWTPVDTQSGAGIQVDLKEKAWPVSMVLGYQSTSESDFDPFYGVSVDGKTTELDLGAKYIWDKFPHVRPYVGGGLSHITGEISVLGISETDSANGFWISGGVYWTLAEHLNLGLMVKVSKADITMGGVKGNAGGTTSGLMVGYHF
jgi:outer membrane protein W